MGKKEEILKRSKERKGRISVEIIDMKSDKNSSFIEFSSLEESWEMLAKISKENYFLQTGKKPENRTDKSVCRCI
jgi:hypothetical protein